ncbi:MAG: ORF6N domain-containing protein [Deltaproteobacteria bacterium]|nr:ORF6N domain-containing protein [Deltaproteobacteria bacterium]
MIKKPVRSSAGCVEEIIQTIRGQKVILDSDLADMYGTETKILNKAVNRNRGRFPADFAFRLTPQEVSNLRFQNGTSSSSWGGRRYAPYAFTEHGAVMAANVLRTKQAEEMSVFVVRAFVKMREHLLSRAELETRLVQIEKVLLAHDDTIRDLYRQIRPLLLPPEDPPKKPIGFHVAEKQRRRLG